VVGTFVGTGISIWQARIAQKSADAAESAAATATNSLKLTKQIIESSEAAFIDWDVSVISFHAQSVSVVFKNSGRLPARNIVGTVTLKRASKSGKIIQSTVRPFTRNVISPNGGFINELIGISTSDDLNSLLGQDTIASATISFDDGVKRSTQHFCSGMIVVLNSAAFWENCENLADHKKYLHDY
jgi:hypothetical protein